MAEGPGVLMAAAILIIVGVSTIAGSLVGRRRAATLKSKDLREQVLIEVARDRSQLFLRLGIAMVGGGICFGLVAAAMAVF